MHARGVPCVSAFFSVCFTRTRIHEKRPGRRRTKKARASTRRKHALMPSRGEMAGQVGRRVIAIAPQSHHRAYPAHANHRSRGTSTRHALHSFLNLRCAPLLARWPSLRQPTCLAPHYPLHTLCTPSAHCSRAPSPPALTRVRPPHTPQDWGANVVFSSRPTSARPQSARGPGGAPAGPGPSMSKVAGKTNQQLEDETEELKRKHRLAPRSGVPSAPCAMPSSHPPNVRPPQIKRSALTSRRRSCRRATQRACRKRI